MSDVPNFGLELEKCYPDGGTVKLTLVGVNAADQSRLLDILSGLVNATGAPITETPDGHRLIPQEVDETHLSAAVGEDLDAGRIALSEARAEPTEPHAGEDVKPRSKAPRRRPGHPDMYIDELIEHREIMTIEKAVRGFRVKARYKRGDDDENRPSSPR
jgi:hypothetical protein